MLSCGMLGNLDLDVDWEVYAGLDVMTGDLCQNVQHRAFYPGSSTLAMPRKCFPCVTP